MADHPTRSVCTLAALTSLILVITGVPGVRMGDLPFLVFLLAPYLLLGLLAPPGSGKMSPLSSVHPGA